MRRDRIEQITDLVARNFVHPKQGGCVVMALLLLHPDLTVEERLCEKNTAKADRADGCNRSERSGAL